MTTFTIHDEATRQAIIGAVWQHVLSPFSDATDNAFADLFLCPWEDDSLEREDEFDALIARVIALREEVRTVRTAALGDQVELSVAVKPVRSHLDDHVEYLSEDGSPWARADDPAVLTAYLKACKRLLDELPVEAVA